MNILDHGLVDAQIAYRQQQLAHDFAAARRWESNARRTGRRLGLVLGLARHRSTPATDARSVSA